MHEFKVYMGYGREYTQLAGLKIRENQENQGIMFNRYRSLENKIQLQFFIKIKQT